MTDAKQTGIIQIQPVYASRSSWEALAVQEDLSYEVLELSLSSALTDRASFAGCRKWYRESGRVRSVHGAFINVNPGSSDEDFRILSEKRCHESCMLARSLGAENIIFHSGCEPFLRGAYLDDWVARCASFYETLLDMYDIRIWIENSQDVDPDPIKMLMKRIPDPGIGVCLDLGHVNYSRTAPEQWFEELGDRIGYLHLSDNNGFFDEHLPLGEGNVDWRLADAFWRKAKRKMLITLEVGGPEGVRRSCDYLKTHGYFGSGGKEHAFY